MKKLILSISLTVVCISASYGQEFGASKKANAPVADTSTYKIIENSSNIDVFNDLEIRKKISFYRKKDQDYVLDFGNGLKVLIYKEEE